MSCSRGCRSESRVEAEETVRCEREEVAAESELESFRGSKCFLVVWRDRNGRKRCKCCCRQENTD